MREGEGAARRGRERGSATNHTAERWHTAPHLAGGGHLPREEPQERVGRLHHRPIPRDDTSPLRLGETMPIRALLARRGSSDSEGGRIRVRRSAAAQTWGAGRTVAPAQR